MTEYQEFVNEKIWEYLPSSKVKIGDDINFRCPFCGDSKKSSTKKRGHYSISKGVYHCFNCDCSMSGLKLLEHLSGNSFEDIKTEYIKLKLKSGVSFGQTVIERSTEKTNISILNSLKPIVKQEWRNPLTDEARAYLEKRRIFDSPFISNRKFYSVSSKSGINYILIPWTLNSVEYYYQLNDFQHRDAAGRKYIFPRKTEKPLYGLDQIDLTWPYIIVFEGVYDSLFVKNGVCSGGKCLTEYQQNLLAERYPNHEIVLAFDNDKAGLTSMSKIIAENPTKFKYFKWFNRLTKEKDINEYVLSTGNPLAFSDKNSLENMIVSSVEMKLYLMDIGIWQTKQRKYAAATVKSPVIDFNDFIHRGMI